MTQTRRERLRESTLDEIKQVAITQIGLNGAASLSLRAIATEMGLSAPALYNYYNSRDELVTALIVDAYISLGDTTGAAKVASGTYGEQFLAVSVAFREWGLRHREQFILIYGSPIPGYHAPAEVTTPVSQRATEPFVQILADAWQAGELTIPAQNAGLTGESHRHIEALFKSRNITMPAALIQIMLAGWGQIHGLVSLELYGHQDYLGTDMAEIYRTQVIIYLRNIGLLPY